VKNLPFLVFGALFGFFLSRVGASDYNLIYRMFELTDLTLAWVILTAIVTAALGMRLLLGARTHTFSGTRISVKQKPLVWLNAAGGVVFGVGWAMSGACPGTVLAQLGEGKLLAVATVLGLVTGTYIYAVLVEKWPSLGKS